MDFFIHTMFQNRHITITLENTIFNDNEIQTTIGIIDLDENGVLVELSENEFYTMYSEGVEFVGGILDQIDANNKKIAYSKGHYILIV